MAIEPDILRRALVYWRLPGVTRADVQERFGIAPRALSAAAKRTPVYLSRAELALAALTERGERTEGVVDAAGVAAFVDWQNHDGTTAADVPGLLAALVDDGLLALDGDRWRLLREWP